MTASAAPPQSFEQQKVILRMVEKASNGKELLLTMRAWVGVFPSGGDSPEAPGARQVCSTVTAKMMKLATLDQLLDYAAQYPVDPLRVRRFVERMFQLADGDPDPHVWHRIRAAAYHLKVTDLERRAQARAGERAGR